MSLFAILKSFGEAASSTASHIAAVSREDWAVLKTDIEKLPAEIRHFVTGADESTHADASKVVVQLPAGGLAALHEAAAATTSTTAATSVAEAATTTEATTEAATTSTTAADPLV